MEDKWLRKSVPLKILSHLSMFVSFAVLMVVVVYVCFYVQLYFGESQEMSTDSRNVYFNSSLFYDDYSSGISSVISLINACDAYEAYGDISQIESWRQIYMGNYVNFQYALYDTKGELIVKSPGFDLTPEDVSPSGGNGPGKDLLLQY